MSQQFPKISFGVVQLPPTRLKALTLPMAKDCQLQTSSPKASSAESSSELPETAALKTWRLIFIIAIQKTSNCSPKWALAA